MTTVPGSVTPHWLRLRERADALARSDRLVASVSAKLPDGETAEIHDLGSGSGSMGRWLAPRLPTSQRWVLHDRDEALLEIAAAHPPAAPDGHTVLVEVAPGDLARLVPGDLSGASLVTTSALADILTLAELTTLVDLCTGLGCPALLTLSVTGDVGLWPPDPLDAELASAFNDHQRRTVDGRTLLGPDAPRRMVELFAARRADVEVASSPWRLGFETRRLTEEWLAGWVGAACEQRPGLGGFADSYLALRREQLVDGLLEVTVGHVDILATPRGSG
ncbi:SAM-dependent methyltransferase [Nostocoides sp. F2B08]|uniref:SAM-dependent methyltransferase n=1 Tax=Nostocoides sp. F2B08 TaxID=2653936 RepID=UPI00186B1C05|nr:SAM-dependent methyltransferase [Tetrasphaera sp. F2B08]